MTRDGRAILAGACATLLGVGLQRFAYAPLLPAMVQAQWLSAGDAGLLGATNFAGYLVGAGVAPSVGRAVGMRPALRGATVLAVICFALCAWRGGPFDAGLSWYIPWRLLAGISGGVLMVLAGPAVQQAVAPASRAFAAGTMFVGVGVGIAAGAVMVPALLPLGLSAAWLALAAAAILLTMLAWPRWPRVPAPPVVRMPPLAGGIGRLLASYTLGGAAAAAHMGWWPDFIARGLGYGTGWGSASWLLFGIAVAGGAGLCGRLAGRIGVAHAYLAIMALQVPATLLPLLSTSVPSLVLSTLLAGATTAASSALALTRARELAGEASPGLWRACTMGWAAAQTLFGFALAALYKASGSHLPLFAAAFVAALAAALLAIPAGRGAAQKRRCRPGPHRLLRCRAAGPRTGGG